MAKAYYTSYFTGEVSRYRSIHENRTSNDLQYTVYSNTAKLNKNRLRRICIKSFEVEKFILKFLSAMTVLNKIQHEAIYL